MNWLIVKNGSADHYYEFLEKIFLLQVRLCFSSVDMSKTLMYLSIPWP